MKKIKEDYIFFIIGFVAIIISLTFHSLGFYSLIETKLYDYRFQLRGPLLSFDSDVVLVEIDDETYRLLDEPYPYPRDRIWAKTVRNLTKAGAKVIAFDIQFDSKDHQSYKLISDTNYYDADLEFSDAITFAKKNDTKIVLASKFGYEQSRVSPYYIVNPNPLLQKNSYTGLVDHEVDEIDNFSRRYTIFNSLPDDTVKYFSFGLQTVMCFLDIDSDSQVIQNLKENKIIIDKLIIKPYRGEASFLVNYYGPTSNVYGTFPVYSLSNIVDDSNYNLKNLDEDQDWIDMFINIEHPLYKKFGIDKSPFRNKIVIIGSSLKEDHDFEQTPFFSYNDNENPIPGLEFHANAIQQLIHNHYITVPTRTLDLTPESFIYHLLIIIFFVVFVLFLSQRLSILRSIIAIIITSMLWFSFSIGLFINDQFWVLKVIFNSFLNIGYPISTSSINDNFYLLPVFYPIPTILITYGLNLSYNLFEEQKNKNFLKETFGRYISPELIDEMYTTKKIPELGGESGIRTAFFSDIESFTSIAEKLSATELVKLLNEFLSEQTEILINNNGTLDKYEGDAILAFFGAPVYHEKHARQALDTGVNLQENLEELKIKWKSNNRYSFKEILDMKMRIGINTGEMVTGNMGSKLHMNYTMMGEEVNLASRLESGSKRYGIYFHTTYKTLKAAGLNRYEWRYIDRIIFKGFTKWKQTVEILGHKGKVDEDTEKLAKLFNKGLDYYYKQNWDEAIIKFQNCLKYETITHQSDLNPSVIFLSRCEKYKKESPPSNWEGVTILGGK